MTIDEYIVDKLNKTEEKIEELTNENAELKKTIKLNKKILEILQKHARLENGNIWISIMEYTDINDINIIANFFDLKESNANE